MLKRTARAFGLAGWSMQTKLIVIFLLVKVIPLVLLTLLAWYQFTELGATLRGIAVKDSTNSLNDSAVKNIERMSTDIARQVADFLYARDDDLRFAARLPRDEASYRAFLAGSRRRMVKQRRWTVDPEKNAWVGAEIPPPGRPAVSSNPENNDEGGFRSRPHDPFEYVSVPLFDEITFVGVDGVERLKAVAPDTTKRRHRPDPALKDVSRRENTFAKAETYFDRVKDLPVGGIYVSDVTGAYVGTNFLGVYTPENVRAARRKDGGPIEYAPEKQAFAGRENPVGVRFEGIVRWATPVAGDDGEVAGYVTLALNHDHIMEFVDHVSPLDERYVELTTASEGGNYAFIWDYKCRSICHPRHHSIVGFDPATGDPQIPWLEDSLYKEWKASGVAKWFDYVKRVDYPLFHEQSRLKKPADELTDAGLMGLDGRYLNNAPQCVGWMDLTEDGGSGSFYILWTGVYKLNTAAAIPYYTGPYAPSAANNHSRRGFGFVAIGSGREYFTQPARTTGDELNRSIDRRMAATIAQLVLTTAVLTAIVIFIAVWMAWHISRPIKGMAAQMSRLAIGDVASAEVAAEDRRRSDEIGLLARSLHDLTVSRRDELDMANAIAEGDYTRSIPLRSDRDQLGRALNAMVRVNNATLSQVNQAVVEVGDGAGAVSDVSDSLSRGVRSSEAVLRTISDTAAHVGEQAQTNADHARDANRLAVASREAARRGYDAVAELSGAMREIRRSGKEIATVAKLIDTIAFQTNLLALNAAVEAARAGRQGKGFAVVAEEVRNLSARSAKAAHETAEMVEAMLKRMEAGGELAERSDREFSEIVGTTTQTAQLFESIADASNAQSSSMAQVVERLGRIDAVIQDNSLHAKHMSDAAGTLSRQAEELRQLLARFRLDPSADDRSRNEYQEDEP